MTVEDTAPAALAKACAEVRAATAADAVAGAAPRWVAAPASAEEASALLRAAAGLGLAVLPRGGCTRLAWGLPPRQCDLVVETRLLDAVLEHSAGDQVATVQAGVPLAALADVLGRAGQRLALDPPATDGGTVGGTVGGTGAGTVGGLLAAGVAGPLRLRYGLPRDLLLGLTMVLADGTIARSGGKVVKNVAGYDLGKLLSGSCGTLGLITEATLRLHPLPRAVAYVSVEGLAPGAAAAALLAVASSVLAPAAAELDWPAPDGPAAVAVLLEGDEAGVAQRADQVRDLLVSAARDAAPGKARSGSVSSGSARAGSARAGAGSSVGAGAGSAGAGHAGSGGAGGPACAGQWAAEPPPWWGLGPAAAADGTVLRIGTWAGQLPAVLAAIRAGAARSGLAPATGGSGAAGVLHAALPAGADPAAIAGFVTRLRAALPEGRSSVVVLHAPAAVREAVDLWGPVPGLALMRAVKEQFDPGHRMAPGRLAGGI